MRKIIYIIFLFSSFVFSQIKVEIKFAKPNDEINRGKFLEIKIINNSDYILPIDTTDFKTFYTDEGCIDFSDLNNYSDLMLKVDFNNMSDGSSIMSLPHYKITGQIDEKDKLYIGEINRRDSLIKLQNNKMVLWKKQNKIQQSDDWIYKNKNLISSMLFIKGKRQIKFYKYFNPKKFNVDLISGNYDYYDLTIDNEYKFSLKYCIDSKIYEFLTKEQTNKLSGYTLFSGSLESNNLKWKE